MSALDSGLTPLQKEARQKVFDTAVEQIYRQGGPAYDVDSCMYRSPDGRKCNFGAVIPDAVYAPHFEKKCADDAALGDVLAHLALGPGDRTFVYFLQRAHDDPVEKHGVEHYERNMRGFSIQHQLSTATLERCAAEYNARQLAEPLPSSA